MRTPSDYTIGWISALPIELAAAEEMLDEKHKDLQLDHYSFGSIAGHNVVLACLPSGQTGTGAAAVVATRMQSTFPIHFGLMVGIGGGAGSVRLGDVVVSQPGGGHGGVIQYDFGKARPEGFERTGFLNAPPVVLLNAVSRLRAKHDRGEGKFQEYVSKIGKIPKFSREAAGPDDLHAEGRSPAIHYGTIASGNQVMRSAQERDKISAEFGGVLCFEMEAAGLMNSFPCLVVRGICDYADEHKEKSWQPYAAAVAAAYTKDLLGVVPVKSMEAGGEISKDVHHTSFGDNNSGVQGGTSSAPMSFSIGR